MHSPTPGRRGVVVLAATALALVLSGATAARAEARRIALSFDDAPTADGALFSGSQRTAALIRVLADAGVEQAGFFVTTRNLAGPAQARRLRAYAGAGHALANHSHGHRWLSRTPAVDYLADIDHAARALAPFDGVRPWFRFPFLDEGADAAERDRIRAGLAERGLRNGYVTVDNYDWYLAAKVDEAVGAGREVDFEALRDTYVDMLVGCVEFYDAIARRTLGRSPAHVLLLHENDLAALYAGDLVRALRHAGWRVIRIDEAYADPIAEAQPQTLFNGQGRVAALAHADGAAARGLIHVSEDEAWIDAEVERAQIFGVRPDGR
ncbi:polysaccharide deacetylase family protein [Luteimonas sp. RD2P54]|uniref:Polysaccharide deacetylase family protein n=1 Tax=Luteimonas endophytica TaxID=3042023 RepID=A0ABT6JBW9_9GAMM|nr:polysaccharide deacetylase family protein [Luteimonas endophytica]MDH5823693.1 polysaccharide deacetylase family protein [Luteimonas endophytica]